MPIATAVANQFVTSISASGATTLAQPSFTNLSGTVAASQMPALTGDVTTSAGAVATTLATVNSNTGSFGSSTAIPVITVNGKGLITAVTTASASVTNVAPTFQKFTSGSGTYNKNYTFIITSGSATVGATYTNNSVTFTVYATVASATQVVMSGNGAPAASGTLTKASGTGDSTLTFSAAKAPLYLKVRMVGGGGGSSGSGTSGTGGAGGAGGSTTFGSSLLTAGGGSGGATSGGGGTVSTGGTATINSPAVGTGLTGGSGGGADYSASTATYLMGSPGGNSAFGGGGGGVSQTGAGAGATNTGGGGGGAGSNAVNSVWGGAGGGAGAFIDALLTSPSATYAYGVGAAGTAGTAGTSGAVGLAGGSGYIEVWEYYQ